MPLPKLPFDPIKILLLISLVLFSFIGGMAAVLFEFSPYTLLIDAKTASDALHQVTRDHAQAAEEARLAQAHYKDQVKVPTVRNHSGVEGDELILVGGGEDYLRTEYEPGCLAWLMDRTGQTKHIWEYDPDLWSDLQQVSTVPGFSVIYPVGLHMYADGGLLVSFQATDSFPFAVGIARYDRNSNLLWKQEILTHHWFSVTEDGRIFVPAVKIVDSPIPIGNTEGEIRSKKQKILSDFVLILDENGNILDEISMLDALIDSSWEGVFQKTGGQTSVETDDPTHLNDVRLVNAEWAEAFPWLNVGDMLVSFRNVNAVGILDPVTRRFKWMSVGAGVRQHSPRFYDNGVLILDNRGGDKELGGTQLVHVDLERRVPHTLFPISSDLMPDKCFTEASGHLDLHRDGHRVLMAVSGQGSIWEIDLRDARVLWEYIYVHLMDGGYRKEVLTAKYVYEADFPFNRTQNDD